METNAQPAAQKPTKKPGRVLARALAETLDPPSFFPYQTMTYGIGGFHDIDLS